MSDYTYKLPEPLAFLHTLRRYLEAKAKSGLALKLASARCDFKTSSSYSNRWNAYWADFVVTVPVARVAEFTSKDKEDLKQAANEVIPKDAGYDFYECVVSPLIEMPLDETPLGNAMVGSTQLHEHDGLRFRSKTEIKVYDELKRRNVLFFPNATAVLGKKDAKREPDFLVCEAGAWGILEVMGDSYHPPETAMKDHDRARLFKDYGLLTIEFYDATRCYDRTAEVVDDFLARLAAIRRTA